MIAWVAGALAWLAVAPPLGVLAGRGIRAGQHVVEVGSAHASSTPGRGCGAQLTPGPGSRLRATGAPASWRCR
ncbi:hypothetical protein [Geodermatophilus ruber]|uniref:Uncharacterized protein n=1 Tax=Geodermatophilus ruber TaxID=504800 RepID=A0A1I4GHG3_9ACTN|nr:hypothetical protein [Geodermatophilus ruber]SFL29309.1 hypothetical protein SAMN04488085_1093 [Geodermatophilus ruber]